jgi:hypothetical protein
MITNGTYTYIWDDENRLVEVRQHGVCLQKNRYDGSRRATGCFVSTSLAQTPGNVKSHIET